MSKHHSVYHSALLCQFQRAHRVFTVKGGEVEPENVVTHNVWGFLDLFDQFGSAPGENHRAVVPSVLSETEEIVGGHIPNLVRRVSLYVEV